MKYFISTLLFIFLCYYSKVGQCQELIHEKSVYYKISFLGPSVSLEYVMNNFWTLNGELGFRLQGGFRVGNTVGSGVSGQGYFRESPFVRVESRFYTNFEKRLEKGKPIKWLSGDYFSVFGTQIIPTANSPIQFHLGVGYGLQRHITKHLYWGLQAGAYKPFARDESRIFVGTVNLKFGLIY